MEVSFSDAKPDDTGSAVRYICLLAILLALPETSPAQVNIVAGRNNGPPPSSAGRSDGRSGGRSDDRAGGRSDDRSRGHSSDNRQSDQSRSHQGRPAQLPTTGLGHLGLQPAQLPTQPWWERRQTPSWEQRQVPSWERQQVPAWELTNPTRAAQSLYPQPVHYQRYDGKVRSHRNRPPVYYALPAYGYYLPGYGYGYGYGMSSSTTYVTPPPYETPAPYETPSPEPVIETGFLKLEVEPRQTLQIFVDGLYIGTLSDIGDEIELRLGARRIELRAPGYRTLIFDTQIVPDRTIIYRGALEPISNAPAPSTPAPGTPAPRAPQAPQAPEAPQAPAGNRVIYLIPGCYMGNVSPKDIKLRSGCDISKLTTISPQ